MRGLAWLLGLLACAPAGQVRYEERLEAASPTEEHAVHAERLHELMQGLDRLSGERLPRAMDPEQEREWRIREVQAVAAGIAASAGEIPAAAPASVRGGADAAAFRASAARLERRARALERDAGSLDPDALDARVSELREACAACHRRFRPEDAGGGP